MRRFIEGDDRQQVMLMPEVLDDYVGEDVDVHPKLTRLGV